MKLVDTDGKGVDGLSRNGVLANGKEYELDVIVWASGFVSPSVGTAASKAGIELTGRGGQRLEDKFQKNGVSTLHGVTSRGFPNLFWQGALQATGMFQLFERFKAAADHSLHSQSESDVSLGGPQHTCRIHYR